MGPKKRKGNEDLFKCGGCQQDFYDLDEFITHKSTCDGNKKEQKEVVERIAEKSPAPLPEKPTKDPPRKRGRPSKAELAERERRREEERRAAEAQGGCKKCDGCTRTEDCGRCVPCQSRRSKRGPEKGSSSTEQCIMRKCELLTEDSDVFKAIGDLSQQTSDDNSESASTSGTRPPRKQRQSKAACTDFLKRFTSSTRGTSGASAVAASVAGAAASVIMATTTTTAATTTATTTTATTTTSTTTTDTSTLVGSGPGKENEIGTSKTSVPSISSSSTGPQPRKKRLLTGSGMSSSHGSFVASGSGRRPRLPPLPPRPSAAVAVKTKQQAKPKLTASSVGSQRTPTLLASRKDPAPPQASSKHGDGPVSERDQQVVIVNSDQLSLLQNSQGIVLMQGTDSKTLQVEVVRLDDGQETNRVERRVFKDEKLESEDEDEDLDDDDEDYTVGKVHAIITRGPAAFGRKLYGPVPGQPSTGATGSTGMGIMSRTSNVNDFLTLDQRRLLARKKGTRSRLLSMPRTRRNRLFIVAPDGVVIEITGAALMDREKTIEKADEKMPYIREKMALIQQHQSQTGAQQSQQHSLQASHSQLKLVVGDESTSSTKTLSGAALKRDIVTPLDALRSKAIAQTTSVPAPVPQISLEECTVDFADLNSMQKLPNQIQLVESDLPLTEAENVEALSGNYLFRQIYSSQELLRCLFCRDGFTCRFLIDLEKHYHVMHEIQSVVVKAEFSDAAVFICLPDDVTEETILKSACQFCSATLRTLAEVREHYTAVHARSIRHIYEGQLSSLADMFHCAVCVGGTLHQAATFEEHHDHMKSVHLRTTLVCKYCNYCTSRPGRLKAHVKQRHLDGQPGPHVQCPVCSVYVHGRERLFKHVLLSHAVQTGPSIWSCARCLYPATSHDALLDHITNACMPASAADSNSNSKRQSDTSSAASKLATAAGGVATFKCFNCDVGFSSKEQFEKHVAEDKCALEFGEHDIEGLDDRAVMCFLCNITLKSPEVLAEHLHHVHMKWVKRTVRAADSMPECTTQVCPLNDSTEIIMDSSAMLDQNEIPTKSRLQQMGFPNRVGHYCHLCDIVIKNYTLFYMHMHNLHGMQKRFICVVTACSNTFEEASTFQIHTKIHNQRGENFCAMCDMVFNGSEDLQDHFVSPQHATQHLRAQDKHNRSEPRNYRCRICHTWHGLFAAFVRHMETESHQYQCQHCGQLFVQPAPRRNHIQHVHPDMANICEICGAKAASAHALWSHLSQHSVVHECSKCNRRFLQKEQLVAHMDLHSPPTPCPWEGCNRRLSTKVGLYNHLRLHRGECDFKCPLCGRGFFRKKSLEIHLKSHESEPSVGEGTLLGPRSIRPRPDNSVGMPEVRLICSGCVKGFDSDAEFEKHRCSSTASTVSAETFGLAASSNGGAPDHIFVDANGQPIIPTVHGHHASQANGDDIGNVYLADGSSVPTDVHEGVVSIRKDLSKGIASITVWEAGTQFLLEVEGGREGIQDMDENIAIQLLRAAAGDDVTHLQVEDKGRTTQYKILRYREQALDDETQMAMPMEAGFSASEVQRSADDVDVKSHTYTGQPASSKQGSAHRVSMETDTEPPSRSIEQATTSADSVAQRPDEVTAAEISENSASTVSGATDLGEHQPQSLQAPQPLLQTSNEQGQPSPAAAGHVFGAECATGEVAAPVPCDGGVTSAQPPSSLSSAGTLPTDIILDESDHASAATPGSAVHQERPKPHQPTTDLASGVAGSSSQSMVVMIGEQALNITIPEGVDPQSFVSSSLIKVNQGDGTERVLLVPVGPDGDMCLEAGVAIDGSILD